MVIQAEMPPLRCETDGAIRVGNSRVLLEIVIWAYQGGSSPEAIAEDYSTTTLGEVYAVIGYYLRHREEVEAYLRDREERGDEVQRKIEALQGNHAEIRKDLKSRMKPQS
jgi:uncharacterized protein (DUF433 family)